MYVAEESDRKLFYKKVISQWLSSFWIPQIISILQQSHTGSTHAINVSVRRLPLMVPIAPILDLVECTRNVFIHLRRRTDIHFVSVGMRISPITMPDLRAASNNECGDSRGPLEVDYTCDSSGENTLV